MVEVLETVSTGFVALTRLDVVRRVEMIETFVDFEEANWLKVVGWCGTMAVQELVYLWKATPLVQTTSYHTLLIRDTPRLELPYT